MAVLSNEEIVAAVARLLGEREAEPIAQLTRALELIGAKAFLDAAAEAKRIYQDGGMLTLDGTRQRTLGGIMFRQLHSRLDAQGRHIVWPHRAEQRRQMRENANQMRLPREQEQAV